MSGSGRLYQSHSLQWNMMSTGLSLIEFLKQVEVTYIGSQSLSSFLACLNFPELHHKLRAD